MCVCVCACMHACMCAYTSSWTLQARQMLEDPVSDSVQSKLFLSQGCYSSVRQKTINIHTPALSALCSMFKIEQPLPSVLWLQCILYSYHGIVRRLSPRKSKLVPSVTLFQAHLYGDLISGPPKLVPSVTLFQIYLYSDLVSSTVILFQSHMYGDLVSDPSVWRPCFRSTCFRSTSTVSLFQIHLYNDFVSDTFLWQPCFRSTCMAILFQIHLHGDLVSDPPVQ